LFLLKLCSAILYIHPQMRVGDMHFFLKKCSGQVLQTLGCGHTERVYHNALITHLSRNNVSYRSEVVCPYYYMGHCVGFGTADLVIGDLVVELKALKFLDPSATLQLRKYQSSLSSTNAKQYDGLLINFNQRQGIVETIEIKNEN
jgi:GxxExxY protein